jgi:hypothetical protein
MICWTIRCGTKTWRIWSSSRKRKKTRDQLILVKKKSKRIIKWSMRITTKLREILMTNSQRSKVRKTNKRM